jgi:predicted amidophosphoribosyltransferase
LTVIHGIAYASCYVYSPTGTGAMCELSRLLCERLKAGDARFMLKYALRVREQACRSPSLAGFFGATDVLVPVPGSVPHAAGRLWAAEELAAALINEGLGGAAWSGLHRVRAVHKSATAPPGERPTVELHYDSFRVEQPAVPPGNVVLIDDVVTKGRTLLAAAWRVQEAFPCAEVRAFALLRTMGRACGVRQLLDPCKGEIQWRRRDAHRCP